MNIRRARLEDRKAMLDLWERAVRASHGFLADDDIAALRPLVAGELAQSANGWWVLADSSKGLVGFLAYANRTIEGLFVDPACQRRGVGRRLVTHAQSLAESALRVDVNERNEAALRFYERMGFAVVGRSATDAGDRPFPILHMTRPAPAAVDAERRDDCGHDSARTAATNGGADLLRESFPCPDTGPTTMALPEAPVAILAARAPARTTPSNYPKPFASRMVGRTKQPLGDLFGLVNFGVNRTRLAPGAMSSLRHAHTKQEEFIYVLSGCPTLVTNDGRTQLQPGMCAGFKAGTGNGHHLVNESPDDVFYLEIGDRTPGDEGSYPDDDLQASLGEGGWRFHHKDGTPY